jgi:hypothetical protein
MRFFSKACLVVTTATFAGMARAEVSEVGDIIKQMVGCFAVTFNYVEDGEHDAFYQAVMERAVLSSEQPLIISRSLILDGQEQLHWSEEWTQQEGRRWQQKVVGPFGDFRYECTGTWTLNQWSCEAPQSPKPRRDQARPYKTIDRVNQLQINGQRWVHSQVNRKITAENELYSVEMGWNLYQRVDDKRCANTRR